MPSVLVGPPDRIVEVLHERREAVRRPYYIPPGPGPGADAPVGAPPHADRLPRRRRAAVAPLRPAGGPGAARVPAGPADRLVQHQRHHAAVHHAAPALVALGHPVLADRALAGGREAHLQALVV